MEVSNIKCTEELKLLFQHISSSELKQFVEDYISANTNSPQQVVVLLQALCSSQRKDIGIVIADDVLSELSSDVIRHSLPCLSASKPTSDVVNMLHSLAFDRNDRSTADVDLTNRAILSLGAAAKKLGIVDPTPSNEIVERLHLELNKHTGMYISEMHSFFNRKSFYVKLRNGFLKLCEKKILKCYVLLEVPPEFYTLKSLQIITNHAIMYKLCCLSHTL